jgi:hypothetical protein
LLSNLEIENKSNAGSKQKMSGLDLVLLSLTDGFMTIDSDNLLFKQLLLGEITYLIQFNKRRKNCFI